VIPRGPARPVATLRLVRLAALDLGSNSFHLVIAEVQPGGFEPITAEKEMLRLGDLVARHGRIPDSAADAAVAVVRRFRQLAEAAGAEEIVACATSALRRAENGGEVVAEEYSQLGTADWQPVIGKLEQADPDWILTAVVGGDAVSFMTQADQFGLIDERGITGTTSQQEFYGALGTILEGRTTALQYSDQTPGADNEAFVAAYREAYGDTGSISAIAATAYEAVRFIAAAVEAAGSYDADAISEQMSTIRLDGLLGNLGFREDNHYVVSDMVLVRIDEGGVYTTLEVLDPIDDTTARSCS